MRILIATGIYPPAIGGPAIYAKNLKKEWEKMGHNVVVKTYNIEYKLPPGIRHIYYFLKIIPAVIWSDFIFALDTFSVGMPVTLASRIFGKKIIMRIGGDFLWEGYVERTRDLVLLKDFYRMIIGENRDRSRDRNRDRNREKFIEKDGKRLSKKEKLIFKLTKWTLHHVDVLIFSTAWQKDIWMNPYDLANIRTEIVENYYGEKEESYEPSRKDFIAGARPLQWKNIEILKGIFTSEEIIETGATYHKETCPHGEFMDKIAHSYASLLVSLGDISPNMILDTIRHNKPFIITEENGLMDRIKSISISVNPKDPKEIKEKILWLCEENNYKMQVQKIKDFNFVHSWEEIAKEILEVYWEVRKESGECVLKCI